MAVHYCLKDNRTPCGLDLTCVSEGSFDWHEVTCRKCLSSLIDDCGGRVTVLCLCEAPRLYLKPDTLYLFRVDRDCPTCLEAEQKAR